MTNNLGLNHYSELIRLINTLAGQDQTVKTVVMDENIDDEHSTLYPLLDIAIDAGRFTDGKTIVLTVALTCVDLIDHNPEPNDDRLYKNNDLVDVYNATLAVLNGIYWKLLKDVAELEITAQPNQGFQKVEHAGKNDVFGWQLTFDIELPNTTIKLCE